MGKDFRVIVAGGRKFNNYDVLKKELDTWKKSKKLNEDDKVTIICGCAEGADDLGREYAKEAGFEVKEFPANWTLLGKVAGILRNKEMAKFASESESEDGVLFAFWNGKSKGTKNMIDTAIQYGLDIHIRSYKDPEYNTTEILEEYYGPLVKSYRELLDAMDEIETNLENVKVHIDIKNI